MCRLCHLAEEDQDHVANCVMVKDDKPIIDTSKLRRKEEDWDFQDNELYDLTQRVKKFEQLCAEKSTR